MAHTRPTHALTHEGAMVMLSAAIAKAEEMGQPQNVVIVDASAVVVAEIRMTGAKVLSLKSAHSKAITSASTRTPTSSIPEPMRLGLGMATQGSVTFLAGGLPIIVDGECIGGIGIGSGTGEQDVAVATAALAAIGAKTEF